MPPKKRDRPLSEEPKSQFEQIQADHELFLQAFEKPTQIYRFLRTRNILSPIFLPRTLAYMKDRSTRKANTRQNFDVNSILEKVEAKQKKERYGSSYKSEFMNLTFLGYFDQDDPPCQPAEVESFLLKICHKKRKSVGGKTLQNILKEVKTCLFDYVSTAGKVDGWMNVASEVIDVAEPDVSSPVLEVNLGKVCVPVNPEVATPSKADVISVGSTHFSHHNGHTVRSYMLLLRVKCKHNSVVRMDDKGEGALCNGDNSVSDMEDEPAAKKSRVSEKPQASDGEEGGAGEVLYGSELVVYDKHRRCQLTEGEYELALHDISTKHTTPKKQATWETIMDGKAVGPFEVFSKCPTVRFKLSWNCNALNEGEDTELVEEQFLQNNNIGSNHIELRSKSEKSPDKRSVATTKECSTPSKRKRIFYQFLYNNNTRQQTEAREDMHCPWCSLNCMQLYSLLKHLRTSHARFNFIHSDHPKGSRIDVSINEHYDGSYVGNPQDLHSHIGYAFGRSGPVRRTPVTYVLVFGSKNKKPVFDLSEFAEAESENNGSRQLVQGHNRLYFHTVTNQPVRACEIEEVDSESENDPLWLRQKTLNLIDEFTDVNEGEKEIMKMWNIHVMRNNYIAECQLPQACSTFLDVYGEHIVSQNLCRNFLLHLANLNDFGLIRSDIVYRSVTQLRQLEQSMIEQGQIRQRADGSIICQHLDVLTADSIL